MKKALITLTILALVASVATAQITFGAWGRTIFVPMQNSGADDEESSTVLAPSWGTTGGGRIGFTIAGNSDNVGFQIDMKGDGGAITAGDQQKMWVKPVSMVKIEVGTVQDDTLRGNGAFGAWNWYRAASVKGLIGEDLTFTRLSTAPLAHKHWGNTQGVIVSATPVEALFVAAAFDNINGGIDSEGDAAPDTNFFSNMFKNAQFAAGYTIEGIGQIRAQYMSQYIGAIDTDDGDVDTQFEVAFKLTAVENLYADFGVRMAMPEDTTKEHTDISAYASYKVSGATLHAATQFSLLEEDNAYTLGVGVDYNLEGGIGLAADVRYSNDIYNAWKDGSLDAATAFGAYATKGFSNGLIGAGVQVVNAAEMGYAIPVRFEYWF